MTFGKTLKKIRIEKGLTQKQLADSLHVTFQTISKWENDINEPGYTAIKDIAKSLGCSVNCLFDEKTSNDLFSNDEVKIKKLPDLIYETYNGIAKISNKEVREYCKDVTDFIKRKAREQTIKDGYFKDEKDFENNYLSSNVETCIYGHSFILSALTTKESFYKFSELESLYQYDSAISLILEEEKVNKVTIIKDIDKLIGYLKEMVIINRTNKQIEKIKGIDKEQIKYLNIPVLSETLLLARRRSFKCRNICSEYVIGY